MMTASSSTTSLTRALLFRTTLTCLLLLFYHVSSSSSTSSNHNNRPPTRTTILVVGSINADTLIQVDRLPKEGENIVSNNKDSTILDVPGGKGCTQAVTARKLWNGKVVMVGQLGTDAATPALQQALQDVDTSHCTVHPDLLNGRGYVFVTPQGQVSAVVCGNSNAQGWNDYEGLPDQVWEDCACLMLQQEIPTDINHRMAEAAHSRGIPVFLDVGGEDRPISHDLLSLCDYLIPNETELVRLIQRLSGKSSYDPTALKHNEIVEMAKILQDHHGAKHVLVTQGARGATLVTATGQVLVQSACPVHAVVDETGAGDCFRAAFVVALCEGRSLSEALHFASAAGACAVETAGAVPSTPERDQVDARATLAQDSTLKTKRILNIPRGDGVDSIARGGGFRRTKDDRDHTAAAADNDNDFPFLIGSRLNSMKDRPDLWDKPLKDPSDFVRRQATIQGLSCVDFNYPQHFHSWTALEAKQSLETANLVAGAVCLRFPIKFCRGAMNHPDESLRQEAVELTKQAAQVALDLGCKEVVVWSAYDGYDYPFQVDYDSKWQELVDAFRECCDAYPNVKFSLEYKPTDENTRFFTVPSTGASLLLVNEVDRPNFGLTLDVGHMLMAGENPGQSIAMAGRAKKLFGIQLNDGYTRLAAEDGLMFGSAHPAMALEIMYQLRKVKFDGHVYFDTFPQRTDPVTEAEYNIKRVKALWKAAGRIDKNRLKQVNDENDAIGALEIVTEALRQL